MMKKVTCLKSLKIVFVLILIALKVSGQQIDTVKKERFSLHAQTTVITQYKPAFKANYSGQNSLVSKEETRQSMTSTLFLGAQLWQGASVFINPEVASGSGLSSSLGVAASTNGESYRIGDPSLQFELARLFFRQVISLGNNSEYQSDDINQLGGLIPSRYIRFTIGKISISDLFDNNSYSHDPRTQFMSWGLMSNGAWDYPANTRGYTPSIVLEYVTPLNELRYGLSLMPLEANGLKMNWDLNKAQSQTLEFTRHYSLTGKQGKVRFLTFYTTANMGSYTQSLAQGSGIPDIIATRKTGNIKYGFGINVEQSISKDAGIFFKTSWNDGKNETWAFTEMDRSVSAGISSNGGLWRRKEDIVGFACVFSGLSTPHKNYLQAGGRGFELGDGHLNYSIENLEEVYYAAEVVKNIFRGR
jgi:high affinity Mn2+ porin